MSLCFEFHEIWYENNFLTKGLDKYLKSYTTSKTNFKALRLLLTSVSALLKSSGLKILYFKNMMVALKNGNRQK